MPSTVSEKPAITSKDLEFADDEDAASFNEADIKRKQVFKGWLLFWLSYQSVGAIYGDIGTSPLYVYSSTFNGPPSRDDLLGALSLIIWTLTLIVTVKYVFIVLCADDEGEGGTFAIYSLLSRYANIATRDPKTNVTVKIERYKSNDLRPSTRGLRNFLERSAFAVIALKCMAVFGVSLIMADGVLTPAQSVLGAIQGLEVVTPNISNGTIIGVSCAILVVLFFLQPLGIAKLASVYAPIVIIWLVFNFSFGIYNLVKHDAGVLKAFSPYFAGLYFVRNKTDGWKSLGGILLAFTGVETLFADLGAFSKRAIQISWLGFVYPCLLLAYIGQAAYIADEPAAYANPFFNTVPPGMFYPSLIISILAAVVASQAIITGTFQLLSQITNMSYFPQLEMNYTSTKFHGQVYIPLANWLLMIGTVVVTAVYNNTTRLGHAYGVCVILVTFITTCMVAFVALLVWRIPSIVVFIVFLPFVTLDGLYLSSALTKVPDGAWFTLLLAGILSSIFILWRYGKEHQWQAETHERVPASELVVTDDFDGAEKMHPRLGGGDIILTNGVGIFFDKAGSSVPAVYAQFLQKFHARPEILVFLQIRAISNPFVRDEDKYTVSKLHKFTNCYRVTARHGYNQEIVTNELGSTVYGEVRQHIIDSAQAKETYPPVHEPAHGENEDDSRATTTGIDDDQIHKPTQRATEAQMPDYRSLSIHGIPGSDTASINTITRLDKAYADQVIYIVGKEQLRLPPLPNGWRSLIGPKAFTRSVLGLFMWIRENTRARVANMKIPVDKLVEVGFVIEV